MFGTAVPVNAFLVGMARAGRNRHTNGHVREEEWTCEKLGSERFGAGQVGRGEHGPYGKRRSGIELGYGLIQDIFVRLFLGNFGLGRI